MNKINTRSLFLWLFAILYLSVAAVSTVHAFSFFGLANNNIMAAMLAGTFEVGQAAVLFSLLTDSENRKKTIPWVLMCMLTLVQVLGNVYSSYEYIITNSMEHLRYFKEPIFIWTDLPDAQANVIVTYIQGSLLPIICLLLTSMVTSYLSKEEKKQFENPDNFETQHETNESKDEQIEDKLIEDTISNTNESELVETDDSHDLTEEPIGQEIVKKPEEIIKQTTDEIETPMDIQNEKVTKPSHFINI